MYRISREKHQAIFGVPSLIRSDSRSGTKRYGNFYACTVRYYNVRNLTHEYNEKEEMYPPADRICVYPTGCRNDMFLDLRYFLSMVVHYLTHSELYD